jgi:UDP-GlcNAc:undecaprenyl-phosphate/decaprenyl-phosphate GlcNAc-1-phosphate transferase
MPLLDAGLMWPSMKAFFIALLLTPILRDVFRSYNIVDQPGHRKIHAYPIPRIGGIPIAIAYGVAMSSLGPDQSGGLGETTWRLLPGAALIFLVGLVDDFFTLKPWVKLAGQVVAALVVFVGGLHLAALAGHPLPIWLDLPLTVMWLLLSTNALNLIDGLDGLCAGIGLVATLTLFGAAAMTNNIPLAIVTLPLAGALLGFLSYNMNPATVFLGDSGALLIGFLLGCYGMIWTQKTATLLSMIIPLLALSVPLLDVMLAILRRFLKKQPVFMADRGHIHHRLLDSGLTPRKAVSVLYVFAAVAAGLAILLSSPLSRSYEKVLLFLIVGLILLGVRQLRYQEFQAAGQFLLDGEFQRRVRDKLRMDNLSQRLEGCSSEVDWWEALCSFGKECEWVSIEWHGPHGRFQTRLNEGEAAWALSVPLKAFGTLRIDGGEESQKQSGDLPALSRALQTTMQGKESTWRALR